MKPRERQGVPNLQAIRPFLQQRVQTSNKENIKASHHWPFGHRWFLLHRARDAEISSRMITVSCALAMYAVVCKSGTCWKSLYLNMLALHVTSCHGNASGYDP